MGSLVITSTYSKKRSHIDKILHDASCATSHGSQLVAYPLAKDLGLSEKIRKTRFLDPREDKSRELSDKRAQERGGTDPLKEKVFKDYSAKRKGAKHPEQMKKFENSKVTVDY